MKMPNPEDFTKVDEPKHYSVADHVAACAAFAKPSIMDAILKKDVYPVFTGFDPGVSDQTVITTMDGSCIVDMKTCSIDIESHSFVSHKAQGKGWPELTAGEMMSQLDEMIAFKEDQFKHFFYGTFEAQPFAGFKPALSERPKRTDIAIMPFTDDELATVRAFKQAVFDRVVYGLTEQGAPGYDPGGGIKYHAYNGSRCALGFFIDKRDYRNEMESLTGSDPRLLEAMRIPRRLIDALGGYMDDVRYSLHDKLAKRFNFHQGFQSAVEDFRYKHRLSPANTAPLREYDAAHQVEKEASPLQSLRRHSYVLDTSIA